MMASTEEKVRETISELKEWLDKPTRKEEDYQKRIDEINQELSSYDKVRKSIRLPFEYLNNWYSDNFVYELLTKENTTFKLDACANGYHNIVLADKLADQYPNNPPKLQFDKATYWLANCLSEKLYNDSEVLIKIINKGLKTKLLSGGLDIKVASWFILAITNKGYNISIDLLQFNYPKDMGIYQEAIDNWDTTNLELLDKIISSLSNFHLEEAEHGDLSEDSGKRDPIFLQFSTPKWFVYTFEILTWLSIREKIGLLNPEKFSHPLMNLKLNQLGSKNNTIPKDNLFNTVLNKL